MSNELSPKQVKTIQALLSEPTITAAAKDAKVTRKTLHTWLKQPEFIDALEAAQRELLSTHAARLAGMLSDAANVYAELILTSEDEAVRLRAADSIHKSFDAVSSRILAHKEIEEFEARLTAMEAALNEQSKPEATT